LTFIIKYDKLNLILYLANLNPKKGKIMKNFIKKLSKMERISLVIILLSLIGLFTFIIIPRPAMNKKGDAKISLQKVAKNIGNPGKADTKQWSMGSEITLVEKDNVRVEEKNKKSPCVLKKIVYQTPQKDKYFFRAEAKMLENLFYLENKATIIIDSTIWKPSYGWPTDAQIKWLVEHVWGKYSKLNYIGAACEYFGIPECYERIVALIVHESSGSPWVVQEVSGAVGLGQQTYSTALWLSVSLAISKELKISLEHLDRSNPEQNIFLTVMLYKRNLSIFKNAGYSNPFDWTDVGHYTGSGAVADTAAFYAGYNANRNPNEFVLDVPFWRLINGIIYLKPLEASLWAQNLWFKGEWGLIAQIREASRREALRKKSNSKTFANKAKNKKAESSIKVAIRAK
jgi:hypothetical protein